MASLQHDKFWLKYCVLLITPLVVCGQINFKSYRDEINPDYIKSIDIRLVNYTDHKAVDGCVVFAHDIKAFTTSIIATVPKRNKKSWVILNTTVDACDLLENGSNYNVQILKYLLKGVRSTSPRFPQKCPLIENEEYCYNDFHLGAQHFPVNFPNTNLNVFFEYKERNVSFYKGYWEIEIEGLRKM